MMEPVVPEVSIIIPAYNAEAFLSRAIESVLIQDGCDFELLIVNNRSTDKTWHIAQQYRGKHPDRIHLLNEKTPGPSAARNCGIYAARAQWIQFLDADDVLLPGKLKRQIELVSSANKWLLGTITLRFETGEIIDAAPENDHWLSLLFYAGMGHLNANLFQTEALKKIGGFDEKYLSCEDFDLFFRLLQVDGCPIIDPVPGAIYIDHAGERASSERPVEMASLRWMLSLRIVDYIKKYKPEYYSRNMATINSALLNCIRQQLTVDFSGGITNLKNYFPDGYQPGVFNKSNLPNYTLFYNMMGFERTERLRITFARLLPDKISPWVKRILK